VAPVLGSEREPERDEVLDLGHARLRRLEVDAQPLPVEPDGEALLRAAARPPGEARLGLRVEERAREAVVARQNGELLAERLGADLRRRGALDELARACAAAMSRGLRTRLESFSAIGSKFALPRS
jgi:hypothetical protein